MVLVVTAVVLGRVAQQHSVCPWRRNGVHRPTASHSAPRTRGRPAGSTRREAGAAERRAATRKALGRAFRAVVARSKRDEERLTTSALFTVFSSGKV
eukprot:scaffold25554_cov70-Phaeocystis_antarctica.AAC.1